MGNFLNGIWLVENEGNWVDDPETLDTTDFTAEGNDYWTAIYAQVQDGGVFVADYENLPGWIGLDTSIEEGADLIKVSGTFQGATFALTKAKMDALKLFFRNHSELGDPTFYFVKRWTTDSFNLYPNASRSQKKYCQVRFASAPKASISSRVLNFSFTLRSMWNL